MVETMRCPNASYSALSTVAGVMPKRLAVARQEIAQWKNFDYLLVSGTKLEDLRRTLAIVEAEKMRSARSQPPEF